MRITRLLPAVLSLSVSLSAATFHVAPHGNDQHPGTVDEPLASFAGATRAVRASGKLGQEPIEVRFAAGTYRFAETAVLAAADSGTATAPVRYLAAPDAEVVFSAARQLDLEWQREADGLASASLEPQEIDQLFIDGVVQPMARYPNFDPTVAVLNGFAADAFSPDRIAHWDDPAGGYIHAMHLHLWGGYHYQITGKAPDGSLRYEGGWQNNRQMGMHRDYRYVENIREELDAPGEWFHDRSRNRLLYLPRKDVSLNSAVVETSHLAHLIELRGTIEAPVRFVALEGFTFRHTARTFMQTKEPLLRSDWAIYRGGALFITGSEDCSISNTTFERLGGNAIFASNYNRRLTIRDTHIRDIGASAIVFVGNPTAVRSPVLFEYKEVGDYSKADRLPGPQNDDYPADCLVEDALITHIGTVEKQVAGVQISMSRRITVRHATISHTPRAGINISEGTWGGHLIEGCDVFDTVLETGDHGSFNSWGRDRFWNLHGLPEGETASFALLDAMEPTIIRRSRWRCDHGWDIDLDDGSSNYYIYDNLLIGGGLKLREGFSRHVWNNVIVNNSLHPHVWYPESGDQFTRNIVMGAYRPIRMNVPNWGQNIDHNFFASSPADRDAHHSVGADAHSLAGDAKFIDAAQGDFRVASDSPALEVGFRNFSMDKFGVRTPRLRAIAPTPEIPPIRTLNSASKNPVYSWLDAKVRALEEGEFSGFGLSQENGGVVFVDAPGHSLAVQSGFRLGDVIYRSNDQPVATLEALIAALTTATDEAKFKFTVRRDQRDQVVTLIAAPEAPQADAPQEAYPTPKH
jgi:hypothetical protein